MKNTVIASLTVLALVSTASTINTSKMENIKRVLASQPSPRPAEAVTTTAKAEFKQYEEEFWRIYGADTKDVAPDATFTDFRVTSFPGEDGFVRA